MKEKITTQVWKKCRLDQLPPELQLPVGGALNLVHQKTAQAIFDKIERNWRIHPAAPESQKIQKIKKEFGCD